MTSTLRKRDKSETYFREVSKARSFLPTLDDGVPSAFLECTDQPSLSGPGGMLV